VATKTYPRGEDRSRLFAGRKNRHGQDRQVQQAQAAIEISRLFCFSAVCTGLPLFFLPVLFSARMPWWSLECDLVHYAGPMVSATDRSLYALPKIARRRVIRLLRFGYVSHLPHGDAPMFFSIMIFSVDGVQSVGEASLGRSR
jgi:hypothetical protein